MPQASKIMIIRHAEKPDGDNDGVTESGEINKRHLTVRGWQRAGALVGYFAHPQGTQPLIAQPQYLFASAPVRTGISLFGMGGEVRSNRSLETILPLSRKLMLQINTFFSKGEEREIANAAQACDGIVLLAWQHEAIADIVKSIPGDHETLPRKWPDARFDIVYVLDLDAVTGLYQFAQAAQNLLEGDQAELISSAPN